MVATYENAEPLVLSGEVTGFSGRWSKSPSFHAPAIESKGDTEARNFRCLYADIAPHFASRWQSSIGGGTWCLVCSLGGIEVGRSPDTLRLKESNAASHYSKRGFCFPCALGKQDWFQRHPRCLKCSVDTLSVSKVHRRELRNETNDDMAILPSPAAV